MRRIKENHDGISTILAFVLIPLSGFATDIYLPSLPSMAGDLHITNAAAQLSLVFFLVSYGVSQLFVGSLLDSFGRFRLGIGALAVFAIASFTIALSKSPELIYLMRIIQGATVAMVVVGKRAYFVDIFSGDKLKNYTSLFSIIWSAAPIVAPFAGGYLQAAFGWESNFYFLGIFAIIMILLELMFGGESLQKTTAFNLKSITGIYANMLRTKDFSLGMVMLGCAYAMLMIYGMTSPFIIEEVFHFSPVVTGYCSLLSGVALMVGGVISKSLIRQPIVKKMAIALVIQLLIATGMIITGNRINSIYVLMTFVLLLHMLGGFIFNGFFSFCLGRFTSNAGIASGITGGGTYIVTSGVSSVIIHFYAIKNQSWLGVSYLTLGLICVVTLFLFSRVRIKTRQAIMV